MENHGPNHDILTQFVNATLSDEEAGEVVAHLDVCEVCSEFVEQLERSPTESTLVSLRELQVETGGDDTINNDVNAEVDVSCPSKIGQYEILRKIGQGGMGVVYTGAD